MDECLHEWLNRPESDTYECLICGDEISVIYVAYVEDRKTGRMDA